MNILMVSHHFDQEGDTVPIGGVQKHIREVTSSLLQKGHKVFWSYPQHTVAKDYNPYDLVIFHDFNTYDYNIPENKVRFMVFHGWEGCYPPNPAVVQVRRSVAEKVHKVFHVGDFIKKMYGTEADETFYGAMDTSNLAYCEGSYPIVRKALWLGRLAPDNAPLLAFEAMKRTGVHLTVCGDGVLKDKLIQGYPNNEYLGFVKDAYHLIKNYDLVIIGGYLSLLEGMIFKKPIVGFYDNPGREIYLKTLPEGITIYPYGTVEEYCSKPIQQYSPIPATFNYDWAKKQTWEKIANSYLKFYDEIIGK